jgi:putative transmembrane protein PGPGW
MLEWFYNNETLLGWLLIVSFISFIATLIAVPVILAKLPEDYFLLPKRHRIPWANRHPVLRIPLLLGKNLLGIVLVIAGILMLALPGQGILTIIVGLMLSDFPGKYQTERWVVSRHSVLRAIHWIRMKANKPALLVDFDNDSDHDI